MAQSDKSSGSSSSSKKSSSSSSSSSSGATAQKKSFQRLANDLDSIPPQQAIRDIVTILGGETPDRHLAEDDPDKYRRTLEQREREQAKSREEAAS